MNQNIRNTWLGRPGGGSVSSVSQPDTAPPGVSPPPSYRTLDQSRSPRTSGSILSTGPASNTAQSGGSDAGDDIITPVLERDTKRLARAYRLEGNIAKIDTKGRDTKGRDTKGRVTKKKHCPDEKEPAPHKDYHKGKALVKEPYVVPAKSENPPPPGDQPVRRRRGCSICVVIIIGVVMALLAGITTTAVLLTRHDGPAVSNSTSTTVTTVTTTSTSIADSTQVYTSTFTSTKSLSTTDTLSTVVTKTDTTLTTSVIVATHTTSPAQPKSTSSASYLGGFDAVSPSSGARLFYTDQHLSLQHIYAVEGAYDYGWHRSDPAAIASNVKPGSPVTASLVTSDASDYSEIYVFFVDTDDQIRVLVSSDPWLEYMATSPLDLVADSMFIRSCVPDSDQYSYHNDADLYLYFASQPTGRIRKYGYWRSSATWKELFDLPPVPSLGREIECQFTGGFESLWMVDAETGLLQQWWRSKAAGQDWRKGIKGMDRLHPHTSLLSISMAADNRTHIIFQSETMALLRYDISGLGHHGAIKGTGVVHPATSTPGTRLATWANEGWCGEVVSVYYQASNTSELHAQTFQDSCYPSGFYDGDNQFTCTVDAGDPDRDTVIPLLKTYGKNVHHHKKLPGLAGFGFFVAACLGVGILIGLCACCCGS